MIIEYVCDRLIREIWNNGRIYYIFEVQTIVFNKFEFQYNVILTILQWPSMLGFLILIDSVKIDVLYFFPNIRNTEGTTRIKNARDYISNYKKPRRFKLNEMKKYQWGILTRNIEPKVEIKPSDHM